MAHSLILPISQRRGALLGWIDIGIKLGNTVQPFSGNRYPAKGNGGAVVGVHISSDDLRLVLSRRGHIEGYHCVSLPIDMELSSTEFEDLLGQTLREFCGQYSHVKTWVTAPLEGHSVRNLRVPKVPRRQLLMAVRWALRRELSTSLKHTVVDYTVDGDVVEKGTHKISVTACAVQQSELDRISDLFSRVGFPLTGLTVPCFTCENLVQACDLTAPGDSALLLDVSQNAAQILVYSKGRTIVNREFRLGLSAFLDASMGVAPEGDDAELFLARLSPEAGVETPLKPAEHDAIIEAFIPVLHRLMRQFDLTLRTSLVSLTELGITQIHLSGPLCACPEIRAFISEHVDLPVVPVNPFAAPCLSLTHKEAAPLSIAAWFMPAAGLALSDNAHTLNMLNPTQSEVEREEHRSLNARILVGFAVVAVLFVGVWAGIGVKSSRLQSQTIALEQRAQAESPLRSVLNVRPVVDTLVQQNRERAGIIEERMGVAMMNEIVALTDDDVQLTDLHFSMASVDRKAGLAVKSGPRGGGGNTLLVKGRIYGEQTQNASALAAYQIRLEESPLFGEVKINTSRAAIHSGHAVLQFAIQVGLGSEEMQ